MTFHLPANDSSVMVKKSSRPGLTPVTANLWILSPTVFMLDLLVVKCCYARYCKGIYHRCQLFCSNFHYFIPIVKFGFPYGKLKINILTNNQLVNYNPYLSPGQGKLVIIIHAPGSGGNHLANLISCSDGQWFARDLDFMQKYSAQGRATPLNNFNVNTFDLINHLDSLDDIIKHVQDNNGNAVFTMHAYELLSFYQSSWLLKLEPIIWMVSVLPPDTRSHRHSCLERILFSNDMDASASFEMVQELIAVYKPDVLGKIRPGYWTSFFAEKLWQHDGSAICSDIAQVLPIQYEQIGLDQCRDMHDIWLPRIMRQIENFRTRKSAGGST